jgi:hypothetical protein
MHQSLYQDEGLTTVDNRNTRPRLAQRMIEVNLYNRNRRSGSPTGSKYCALLIVDFNNL